MDEIDRAQAREQELRDDALAAQHRRAHGELYERLPASAGTCGDCGEPIPEARRRAVPGVQRCTECQDRAERFGP